MESLRTTRHQLRGTWIRPTKT